MAVTHLAAEEQAPRGAGAAAALAAGVVRAGPAAGGGGDVAHGQPDALRVVAGRAAVAQHQLPAVPAHLRRAASYISMRSR